MNRMKPLATLFLLCSSIFAASAQADLICAKIPHLFSAFRERHYSIKVLNSDLKARTADTYLRQLDPSKNLFYNSEIKQIKNEVVQLFDKMGSGDCNILHKIQRQLIKRVKESENYVRKVVSDKKYKIDNKVTLISDPDKRGFPRDKKAWEEITDKFIHYQMSIYISSGTKMPEAKKQLIHRYELMTKRVVEQEPKDLYSSFVNSYALALDPHSSYFSPEHLEDFQISMRLSLEGIGVSLSSQDGYTVVEDIIPGGAADRLKENQLEPKDKILTVSQGEKGKPVDITDMALRDVVRLIRGKKGTKVKLGVLRQADKTEKFSTIIVRDKIDLKEQAAKIEYEKIQRKKKNYKFAVIDLPSFYGDQDVTKRSSYRDLRKLLKKANQENIDGLLLDLSRNGGGLLSDAVFISGLFIRTGGIVGTKDFLNRTEILDDDRSEVLYNGPLIILTSRRSASASEILAGALQDYRRAVVVGDSHTFGKGTVQAVIPLARDLGALKVTTGMFFLPAGKSTQRVGVPSDVIIPSLFDDDSIGEKNLDFALDSRRIKPFLSKTAQGINKSSQWNPISDQIISQLRTLSETRVAQDKEFKEIADKAKELKANRDVIRVAEILKEDDKKKDDKKKKDKKKDPRIADTPQHKEALQILADLVEAQGISLVQQTTKSDRNSLQN